MASAIVGRMACPECDFEGAHVKQSDKCLYRFCPECHSQTFAKTERQQANMRRRMRPVDGAPAPAPAPVPAHAVAAGTAQQPGAAPALRRLLHQI